MIKLWPGIRSVFLGVGLLSLLGLGIILSMAAVRPVGINEIWEYRIQDQELQGKTLLVEGDSVFEPLSDFRYNAFYLVDSDTPAEFREPSFAFWFGIRIEDVHCASEQGLWTCEPFDPSQAAAFKFKGKINIQQVGKKDIIWLSDLDLEHSQQLIGGKWQPIPNGKFEILVEAE